MGKLKKLYRPESFGIAVIHIIFIVVCLICLYPFLVIIGTSFMTQNDIITNGYSIIPKEFSLTAYKMIFQNSDILVNSYLITLTTTIVGTLVGLWVTTSYAFAISRRDYPYRSYLSFFAFFTMLFHGGIVANYMMMVSWLGLKNNIWALILPYLISAWFVLLMKGFLESIPPALFEAAKIDGAGELYIFTQIVIPISKPPLATVGLFMALQYWNDWWLTLLYSDRESLMTLQYLLIRVMKNMEFLNSAEAIQFGLVQPGAEVPTLGARMAMSVVTTGPMLFIFPLFQKYFVRGLTVGSVKG